MCLCQRQPTLRRHRMRAVRTWLVQEGQEGDAGRNLRAVQGETPSWSRGFLTRLSNDGGDLGADFFFRLGRRRNGASPSAMAAESEKRPTNTLARGNAPLRPLRLHRHVKHPALKHLPARNTGHHQDEPLQRPLQQPLCAQR